MFHVLVEGDILLGKGNSIQGGDPTPIFCKTETPRAAVGLKRFKSLGDKLNKEKCCKVCYTAATRKVGRSTPSAGEPEAGPA